MNRLTQFFIFMLALLPSALWAQISVQNPTIVATSKPNQPSAIHLMLQNNGNEAVNLVMLQTPKDARLELHGTINGKMAQIDAINVPAHGQTALRYGGLHIMVFDLKTPLSVGSTFPVSLFFDNGDVLNIEAVTIDAKDVKRH